MWNTPYSSDSPSWFPISFNFYSFRPQPHRYLQPTRLLNFSDLLETSTIIAHVWKIIKPKLYVFHSQMSILSATCHILSSIANAQTVPAKLKRTEELIDHITRYPSARIYAVKEGGVKILLRTRESHTDEALHQVIREALAILGYSEPLPGRGIRILSIDGGGIR